jgi:FKBP-type peptidyl-prolyl cis-trans isomerase FklB
MKMKSRKVTQMKFVPPLFVWLALGVVAFAQPSGPTPGNSTAVSGQSGTAKSGAQPGAAKTPQGTPATKPRTAAAGTRPAVPLVLKTEKEKESYALGMNVGKSLKKDGVDIDPKIVARGIADILAGGKTVLTDEDARAALVRLQNGVRQRQQAEMDAKLAVAGAANKQEGDAFLTANKSQEGVVTLPDGLQYKILKEGDGPKPNAEDSVVCNYKGTLLNNTEFDSSYKRGQPATFPVSGVIKGWTEVLQMMPVGSKWQIFVPPDLAYGARGNGGIGPSATLIFEIELLSIQAKEAK